MFSDSLEEAQIRHYGAVQDDIRAARIPAGMDARVMDSPLMITFRANDCEGDIRLGTNPTKETKKNSPKETTPSFGWEDIYQ